MTGQATEFLRRFGSRLGVVDDQLLLFGARDGELSNSIRKLPTPG